jgi:hypothetical protein
MEKYIIAIKDTTVDDPYKDEYNDTYKEYLITIRLNTDNDKYIDVASFHIPGDIKNKTSLIDLRNKINENIKMVAKLHDCNGFVGLIKENEYLTFETSKYGGDVWGVCNFTVKINDEIPKLLDTILSNN